MRISDGVAGDRGGGQCLGIGGVGTVPGPMSLDYSGWWSAER